jgi:hypothetical protein
MNFSSWPEKSFLEFASEEEVNIDLMQPGIHKV